MEQEHYCSNPGVNAEAKLKRSKVDLDNISFRRDFAYTQSGPPRPCIYADYHVRGNLVDVAEVTSEDKQAAANKFALRWASDAVSAATARLEWP